MIGPFGFEPMEIYKRIHRTLEAPEVCICEACVAAGIALPSILNAEQRQRVDVGGEVREVWMGRWLHGNERKQHEAKRQEFLAALERLKNNNIKEMSSEDHADEYGENRDVGDANG